MDKDEELNLTLLQIVVTTIFIGTIFVSLFLSYNEKNRLQNKKHLKAKTASDIYYINRIVVFILLILYLYISYNKYKIGSKNKIQKRILIDELVASIVTIVAGLIVLYDSYLSLKINAGDIENPEI